MMTKLWLALCALLVVNSGSAEHDNTQTDPLSSVNTEATPVNKGASAPVLNGSDNSTTTVGGSTSLTAENNNDTNSVSPVLPENNRNLNEKLTTQPPVPFSEGQANTSHILPDSTPTSPLHTAHTIPVNTTNTTLPTNTSTSVSKQPTDTKTHSPTSAPTSKPPKPETQSTSTSSTASSPKLPSTATQTATSSQTSQSVRTQARTESTSSPPSSPSAQNKGHSQTPSQLNVGGDTTMVHDAPTLDPLLAGLVSAFIITAVIITLLLFLKLRRRDNRPEFRRLQDLPMDDMMEDTPLSMYTY